MLCPNPSPLSLATQVAALYSSSDSVHRDESTALFTLDRDDFLRQVHTAHAPCAHCTRTMCTLHTHHVHTAHAPCARSRVHACVHAHGALCIMHARDRCLSKIHCPCRGATEVECTSIASSCVIKARLTPPECLMGVQAIHVKRTSNCPHTRSVFSTWFQLSVEYCLLRLAWLSFLHFFFVIHSHSQCQWLALT
jgi:hypothetical protein